MCRPSSPASRTSAERNRRRWPQEAIERLVNYDDWLLTEVDKGLAQVEGGQTVSHEEVGTRLEQRLTKQTRRR